MRLQTLQTGTGVDPTVLAETPWHDDASASGGSYRERLREYLGGFFERDGEEMRPKPQLLGDSTLQVPDAVRVVDENGRVVEAYSYRDLMADTGLRIVTPSAGDLERS